MTWLAAIALLAGAAIQSATGFGLALVAAPALLAVLDPAEMVSTVCLLAVMVNLLMLFAERRPRAVRGADVALILVAAAPGLAVGAIVVQAVEREPLQVGVGAAVIVATLVRARTRARDVRPAPHRGAGVLAGALAGLLTTSTSVNGPPLLLWLMRHAERPEEIRDSLAVSFIALNLAGVAAIAIASGAPQLADPELLALAVPAGLAGWLAGRRAFERIGDAGFRRGALAVSLAAGAASVAAGLV